MKTKARFTLNSKSGKIDCPDCGHRKAFSRYIDNQTGELLPEEYGKCDRVDNCGYWLNPYDTTYTGKSYADEIRGSYHSIPKKWFKLAGNWKVKAGYTREAVISGLQGELIGATAEQAERVAAFIFDRPKRKAVEEAQTVIYSLPNDIVSSSLKGYEQNRFAYLLRDHFGKGIGNELISRFKLGTLNYWQGGTIFWLIDAQQRVRGGQAVLFDYHGHTAKYIKPDGTKGRYSRNVHVVMRMALEKAKKPIPDWLIDYEENAPKWPVPFGLGQLSMAPETLPVAIVEAPKTAVFCSGYFPEFVWLAIGSLGYLNAERIEPLRGRKLVLFPDLSRPKDGLKTAFQNWSNKAEQLRKSGFKVDVSGLLEHSTATEQQRIQGYDLADYLIENWHGYPVEWDNNSLPDTKPVLWPMTDDEIAGRFPKKKPGELSIPYRINPHTWEHL